MKVVQIALDEDLLDRADQQARRDKLNRSQLVRVALREYLERLALKALETQDREGYQRAPVEPGEFDVWVEEQAWPED